MAATAAARTGLSSSSTEIATNRTTTEHRKHRFTLFIGYGEEAGKLLKRFEQLKCRLGIGTNILFLNFLLQYFEDHNDEDTSSSSTPTSSRNGMIATASNFFINDNGCTSVTYNDLEQASSDARNISSQCQSFRISAGRRSGRNENTKLRLASTQAAILFPSLSSETLEKQERQTDKAELTQQVDKQPLQLHFQSQQQSEEYYSKDVKTKTSPNKPLLPFENILSSTLSTSSISGLSLPQATVLPLTIEDEYIQQQAVQAKETELSDKEKQSEQQQHKEKENQNRKDFTLMQGNKNVINNESGNILSTFLMLQSGNDNNENIDKSELKSDRCVSPPAKIPRIFIKEDVTTSSFKDETSNCSIVFQPKAMHIIQQYMEHTKRELDYYHGYISSTDKLRLFLNEYREATNMSFTVRSSRSYIKKRASINLLKKTAVANDELMDSTAVDSANNSSDNLENISLSKGPAHVMVPLSQFSATCKENMSQHSDEQVLDGLITGPLRWEYILGKPSIPFTGIPFFIIGNTHYQCRYASADIRTQRKKTGSESNNKDNHSNKGRTRRSLKRDCKAVMCIKSIVAFPEFTVEEKIHAVKSKKGSRKIKAAALEKVRKAVEQGEAVGHPAFWVCIPLPEAHTTHDLSSDDLPQNEAVSSESENIDAITQILTVAAQYGGKVQIVQQGEESVIEFELSTDEDASSNAIVVTEDNGDRKQLSSSEEMEQEKEEEEEEEEEHILSFDEAHTST